MFVLSLCSRVCLQTNLLKDIKSYLKAAANRESELLKKHQELEEKVGVFGILVFVVVVVVVVSPTN